MGMSSPAESQRDLKPKWIFGLCLWYKSRPSLQLRDWGYPSGGPVFGETEEEKEPFREQEEELGSLGTGQGSF